ncbi:MAG: TolC family protein [Proteobacteria bacterium]|nr:TolC family protein [Pseudomonadota bacterium]
MKYLSCLICFILFFASEALCKEYQIEELLDIAEQNSANIKAADYLASSQKRLANQQKYWSNPYVSFDSNFGNETYSVSQTVPFYNKLQSKYDIEEAEYRVLETRKNNTALFVKADLFSLLYQYQGLKKKIELAQKRIDRLALVDQYLSNIVLNSPTKRTQAQITKDTIKLVERDLVKYRNQLYQIWNRANIYLSLESEPDKILLNWIDGKNYQGREFFINAALENNLDLREQKLLIGKYKSELSFAKIEQMPDVNVSASKQNNSSASGGRQDSNAIGLSLSIPLINRNQEKIASSESKIKSQQYAFDYQKNILTSQINNDLNEYEILLKLSKNFPVANIEKIISRLSSANSDFKKGVLDFITYIELDTREYEVIETIIDTQVETAGAYARVMTRVGSFTIPQK